MKKQSTAPHIREGRPLSRKQFIVTLIGLGLLLVLLVAAFLYGRWYLAGLSDSRMTTGGEPTGTTGGMPGTSAGTSSDQITSALSPVPDRQNGNLTNLPARAFDRGRTITIGVSDPFGLVNPLYYTGDSDEDAVSLIFEPLLRIGRAGEPELVLATELLSDSQNGTLTVRLRDDHIWRDGRSVSAADVVFTYQCLLSSSYDGPLGGRFKEIKTVSAGPKSVGGPSVVFTFQPGVRELNLSLLTVGILKSDYYQVPVDRVYEMGRKALPPEGSGAFQWKSTQENRRILTLRDGFAGDIQTVEQVLVGSDDKYPMLLNGELDLVRHDWNARIEARTERLMGYSLYMAERTDLYLLTSPNREKAGLPAEDGAIQDLLKVAAGQSSVSLKARGALTLHYFSGIESAENQARTAFAKRIADRLSAAGLSVALEALSLPNLAELSMHDDFGLILLPSAADNRLPVWAVLQGSAPELPVNAIAISTQPQVILASARLANLTINPFGAPFSANNCTYMDRIANVRILDKEGAYLMKEES